MGVWDVLKLHDLERGPVPPDGQTGAPAPSWRQWRMARDEAGVAWLILDKAESSANTLSTEVIVELNSVLEALERDPPKGLVIRSGKPAGFIAGADIGEFEGLAKAGNTAQMLRQAHDVIDRLDRLAFPTVAIVHGYCLGGGLELALACDYRIATDDAKFAFPEVQLGLHPGLGGTVRLPRLISPLEALPMMLTGKNVRARRARAIGLVDAVQPERHLRAAALAAINGTLKLSRPKLMVSLINAGPVRTPLAAYMKKETEKKAPREHYPSPHALLDLWEKHGGDPRAMQQDEIASFASLLNTPTAQNLVRVFFLREKMKGLADGQWSGRRIHVIGAGAMGGDIAAWCAWHGFTVTLADMKPEPLGGAIKRAADLFKKIAQKPTEMRDALDRLTPDLKGEGVRTADLVIEAVPEILDLKQKVYAATEPHMKPDAILATNTSSIMLEKLRDGLQRPQRFLGLHFFNPVSRMQLVEVVSHDSVAPDVLGAARAFLGRIDRLPAPVKSAPGFLVNHALMPYLMEALIMLDRGVKRETIDKAAERFGMPMGPIELADEVGLDICVHVADSLRQQLAHPIPDTPQWLRDKVQKGELGKKTGKGLYDWKDGHAVKDNGTPDPDPDTADRLILPMIDACVACMREGTITDEDVIDGAMIFGTGFAPFRGGPLHYARSRGIVEIRERFRQLTAQYGERFVPDPGWDHLMPVSEVRDTSA
jgi:3-hydroxyacyl-CoA dehydrogenase/enoyl-CoA hydratase/3-hydroxybutyryl-CoA epimerase